MRPMPIQPIFCEFLVAITYSFARLPRSRAFPSTGQASCNGARERAATKGASFRFQVCFLDDRLVAIDLAFHESGELINRERRDLGAVVLQPRLDARLEDDLVDLIVESCRQFERYVVRPEKTGPQREIEIRYPGRF